MAKTNWGLTDTVRPSDLNAIGEEINQLRGDVDNMEFPLSDATDGTRSDVAASEKSVGLVMQAAQEGKQAGIDRKAEVVAALNSIGVSASTSESWAQLIPKMASIIRATGNAAAADVLFGKTFSNASGNNKTGAMPDYSGLPASGGYVGPVSFKVDGSGSLVIEPQTGYYKQGKNASGYGSILINDPDFVPGNLPKDINIFGVQGILERLTTADRNAIIAAIVGKGVAASAADSNAVLAQKIGQIITGKRIATGSTISGNTGVATLFYTNRGNGIYKYPLTVTGLDFTPTTVIVFLNSLSGAYANFAFKSNLPGFPSDAWLSGQATGRIDGGSSAQATVVDETFRIFANGFCAPVPSNGWSHGWIAIE